MAVIHQPKTDHLGRVGYPVGALFALSVAYWITRSARDALFLAGDGIFLLPWSYTLLVAGAFPALLVMVWLVHRVGLRRARLWAAFFLAALQSAAAVLPVPTVPTLHVLGFAAVPLGYGALLTVFWLMLPELRGRAEGAAARTESAGAAGVLAGIAVGGGIARLLAPVTEPRILLLIGAIALVAAAGVVLRAYKRFPVAQWSAPVFPSPVPPFSAALRSLVEKTARYRFALTLVSVGLAVLIEFDFYFDAAAAQRAPRAAVAYHSTVSLGIGALAFAAYSILCWLSRFGLRGEAAHPTAVLAASAIGPLTAMPVPVAALRIIEGGLRRGTVVHQLATGHAGTQARQFLVEGWARALATLAAAGTLGVWLYLSAEPGDLGRADVTWIDSLILGGALLLLGLRLAGSVRPAQSSPTGQLPSDASPLGACCLAPAVPPLAVKPDVPGAVQLGERTVIPDPPP